ncbi:mannonate dehydratase [Sporosarcina newyorkensis 2681]|uniref:Mannonate dehydratase n=1 Tax=Sporosarcina newyorkensis 2681 TaxID=1027292 RepID=F9DRS0_9BACL|nr:mannonate dehydratase [Sporosarcina newyorkensis 2681]
MVFQLTVPQSVIQIHPLDNVWIALNDLEKEEKLHLDGRSIVVPQPIKRGHKIAIQSIRAGENIIKYGFPIGRATADINVGEFIHSHNLKTNLDGELDYTYAPVLKEKLPMQKILQHFSAINVKMAM